MVVAGLETESGATASWKATAIWGTAGLPHGGTGAQRGGERRSVQTGVLYSRERWVPRSYGSSQATSAISTAVF